MCIEQRKAHEECGVFGIFSNEKSDTARTVYYALYALQHRGQESSGIAVGDRSEKRLVYHKDLGLVGDVFSPERLASMRGDMAIGHVRYASKEQNTRENAQPFSINYNKGTVSLAFNGTILNLDELKSSLQKQGAVFQTTGDAEVIAHLVAHERFRCGSIEEALALAVPQIKGAFSMLVMSPMKLIAVRDPAGIRPLCMGTMPNGSVVFASESCALQAIGAKLERDVEPGEMVVVTEDGVTSRRVGEAHPALCIFEHIYIARPDSVIDGESVYEARLQAGRILAKYRPADADIVIGAPDSGVVAAIGFAEESGIPYREGLIRNRYIGRTFIQPQQGQRTQSVSIKLGAIEHNVRGRRVVLVDDSIVRGTTMAQTVNFLRDAGAAEVHVRIASPEFLWQCFYGTDIPSRDQLASVRFDKEQFLMMIGADSLEWLPLEHLGEVAKNSKVSFCDACFSGKYPIE